ncbi:MAG: hypothetical protein V4603_09455 [Pseudomonadota bacterium]
MKPRNILRTLALSLLLGSAPAIVQAQPGTAIAETTVSADIVTLFSRAGQFYPNVFVGGTGWFSYSGYTYKYFPAAGIYAGVKDGQVYLMGGAYGNTPSAKGSVTALSNAIQNAITIAANANNGGSTGGGTTVTSDFGNIALVKTSYDLPRYFDELTLEYGSTGVTATLKMERVGTETTAGVSTEHMKVTVSSGSGSIVSDLWVNSAGTVLRYNAGGFEYPAAQAQFLGPSVLSAMLISLAAADNAQVKAIIAETLKSPSLSKSVATRTFSGVSAETLVLSIVSGAFKYQAELSDFGDFSFMTSYRAEIGSLVSSFKVTSMKLR